MILRRHHSVGCAPTIDPTTHRCTGQRSPEVPPNHRRESLVQVRVSARHTEVSDRDRELIVEKIDRLGKFLPGMDHAEVHFSEQRNPRIHDKEMCEVTMEGHGHHIRCRAHGPDALTAVDLVVEKLESQLHKLKSKLTRHRSSKERARARSVIDQAEEALLDGRLDAPLVDEDGLVLSVDELSAADAREEAEVLAGEYRIVKTKTVEKLTLQPHEAAMRMDLLEHGFYFFTNAETGLAAVVYRREDGDIGLIDEGS